MKGIKGHYIDNPIKSYDIEKGLTNFALAHALILENEEIKDTDVRKITNYLCNKRIPIASNGMGYWYARNMEELIPAINQITSRAYELFKRQKNMLTATFNEANQLEIISEIQQGKTMDLQLFGK